MFLYIQCSSVNCEALYKYLLGPVPGEFGMRDLNFLTSLWVILILTHSGDGLSDPLIVEGVGILTGGLGMDTITNGQAF